MAGRNNEFLLFDEAVAVFGGRADLQVAYDRYTNIVDFRNPNYESRESSWHDILEVRGTQISNLTFGASAYGRYQKFGWSEVE